MKEIKAIFKGHNGSMGFIKNKKYNLVLDEYSNGSLLINDFNSIRFCIYESFIAFLNNWEIKNV
jgi:hypothetical protein